MRFVKSLQKDSGDMELTMWYNVYINKIYSHEKVYERG